MPKKEDIFVSESDNREANVADFGNFSKVKPLCGACWKKQQLRKCKKKKEQERGKEDVTQNFPSVFNSI